MEVDRGSLTPHAPIIQFQQLSTHGQSYVLIFHTHYPQPWATLKQTLFQGVSLRKIRMLFGWCNHRTIITPEKELIPSYCQIANQHSHF